MGNKQNKKEEKQTETTVKVNKIFILGSGGVGATTIFKCIKLNSKQYRKDNTMHSDLNMEMIKTKSIIRSNAVYGILDILRYSGGIETSDIDIIKEFQTNQFFESDEYQLDYNALEKLANSINTVWKLDNIQKTYRDRLSKQFALFPIDIEYICDNIKSIMNKQYIPGINDYLRARLRTTGQYDFIETDKNGIRYEFSDFGAEKGERRGWMNNLYDTDCILFVCGLNEYCLALLTNPNEIALIENLKLYQQITTKYKSNKFVVLLNKTDLFREYLTYTPLTFCFDEYEGKNYFDNDQMKVLLFKRVIQKLIIIYIDDMDIGDISNDIIQIMCKYCDCIRYEQWLNLVYQDAVDFIKNKFLSIHSDSSIYELCAIHPQTVDNVLNNIKSAVLN